MAQERVYEFMSPQELCSVMQELGFRTTLETAPSGTPIIKSSAGGHKFIVCMYKQSGEPNFSTAEIFWGFSGASTRSEYTNNWNRTKRFTKAYIDGDGDPCMEFDIMPGGVTNRYLRDCFGIWEAALGMFSNELLRA